MKFPDFSFEKEYWNNGFDVIGIDEVGRGAFAGPVAVGGVIFNSNLASNKDFLSLGINDSKKLTPKKRESLAKIISSISSFSHISFISVTTINEIGIGKATMLAMQEVAQVLSQKIKNPFLLIDAFEIPKFNHQKGIIRGDSLSISIASASIIAKVARDKFMIELGEEVKDYGFEKHKGYGTAFHRNAIKTYGASSHHRTAFCRNYI